MRPAIPMLKSNRILWGEGLFLSPQLFQQQTLRIDTTATAVLHGVCRHAWGLRRIGIDAEALKTGQLRVDALEAVFRDGTFFEAPARDPLPLARDLNELPQIGAATTLYACLPHLIPHGGNAVRPDTPAPRPARYRKVQTPLPDLLTEALEVDATTLEQAIISKVAPRGTSSEEGFPFEIVSISYGKIKWNYIQQKRDGGQGGGNVAAGWDLTTNKTYA